MRPGSVSPCSSSVPTTTTKVAYRVFALDSAGEVVDTSVTLILELEWSPDTTR